MRERQGGREGAEGGERVYRTGRTWLVQVEAAAKTLWRLAEAEENAAPIMWSGGLIQLLHVLGPPRDSRHPSHVACEAVIRALACLASCDEAATMIIRAGEGTVLPSASPSPSPAVMPPHSSSISPSALESTNLSRPTQPVHAAPTYRTPQPKTQP